MIWGVASFLSFCVFWNRFFFLLFPLVKLTAFGTIPKMIPDKDTLWDVAFDCSPVCSPRFVKSTLLLLLFFFFHVHLSIKHLLYLYHFLVSYHATAQVNIYFWQTKVNTNAKVLRNPLAAGPPLGSSHGRQWLSLAKPSSGSMLICTWERLASCYYSVLQDDRVTPEGVTKSWAEETQK